MAFKVFISHSTADMGVVQELKYWLELNGIEAYVAQLYPQPGMRLSNKVSAAIKECDCFIALLTRDGARSAWVNQEIGLAWQAGRLIVPIKEVGVEEPGMIKEIQWIAFDPRNPVSAIDETIRFLYAKKQAKEAQDNTAAVVLTLFGLLALAAVSSRKREESV